MYLCKIVYFSRFYMPDCDYLYGHLLWIFHIFPVWADNADACAKQYAGTGALKTDFTR